MKIKRENYKEAKIEKNSFGYLMHWLYKRGFFSELHLPCLNKISFFGKKVIICKKIPLEFENRVDEISSILKFSRKTNLKIIEIRKKSKFVYVTFCSYLGKIQEERDLKIKDKEKIIKLFFEYHNEINVPGLQIKTRYKIFFNRDKLSKDIDLIIRKIPKKKSFFDLAVEDYLSLITSHKISLPKRLKICNLHGDLIPRNISFVKRTYSLIDLDMVHRGPLEIQFIRLLTHLFSFASEDFFKYLKKYKKFLGRVPSKDLFEAYLYHKIMDTSIFKAAYLTNKLKYKQLQKYILSQIKFISLLIEKRDFYKNLFETKID